MNRESVRTLEGREWNRWVRYFSWVEPPFNADPEPEPEDDAA